MTRPIQQLFLAASFVLFAAMTAPAVEFETLKEAFAQSSATAAAPEYQRYHAALAKLENTLVARKDYPAAIHVQRERLRIAARIEALGAKQTTGNSDPRATTATAIPLDLASAATGGGVTYDSTSGTLGGWTAAGTYAEWTLPDHPEGGYEIELTYSTPSATPGEFILSESFYTLTRETVPTGGPATFANHSVATLRLKSGTGPFRITAGTFSGSELFILKSVRIVPLKP